MMEGMLVWFPVLMTVTLSKFTLEDLDSFQFLISKIKLNMFISGVCEERCIAEINCFHDTVIGTAEDSSQVDHVCLKLPLKLGMQISPYPQVHS